MLKTKPIKVKKEIDKDGRILYKFNNSVSKGGNLYVHKLVSGAIENKEGLRNALKAISVKYSLIDSTIKVYDEIFFCSSTCQNPLNRLNC